MRLITKDYLSLVLWIIVLIAIGSMIGLLTQAEVNSWYQTLNRSALTPPDYIFPIVWTILYALIATCGWMIWRMPPFAQLRWIKSLYLGQLLLNWSWTPLFFGLHATGLALIVLALMDTAVFLIIYLAYPKNKSVSVLMLPYGLWIIHAGFLNFYIWQYN